MYIFRVVRVGLNTTLTRSINIIKLIIQPYSITTTTTTTTRTTTTTTTIKTTTTTSTTSIS